MKNVLAVLLVMAMSGASGCRDTPPTGPSPTATVVDLGTWTGEVKVTGCVRMSGQGKDTCGSLVSTTHPIRLTLQRAGDEARGGIEMFRIGVKGTVAGSFQGPTTATITARLSMAEDNISISVHSWRLEIGNFITAGPLTLRNSFDNIFGPQVREETYQVLRLEKVVN